MEEAIGVLVVGQAGSAVAALRAEAGRPPALDIAGPVPVHAVGAALAVRIPGVVYLRARASDVRDALGAIRRADRRVPVLVGGIAPSDDLVTAVLVAGGCGVVRDGLPPSVLREAILRAWARELVLDEADLGELVSCIAEARGRRPRGGEPLTAREREVFQAVADGLSTAEVADRLGISAATVQSHVKNVLTKLRVHSKVEAVRVGWREGILAVPA